MSPTNKRLTSELILHFIFDEEKSAKNMGMLPTVATIQTSTLQVYIQTNFQKFQNFQKFIKKKI